MTLERMGNIKSKDLHAKNMDFMKWPYKTGGRAKTVTANDRL